ncbi:substrate-binding domain-containing protein [Thalassococcus sp. BH17M4-6]|uniref:substrate-binding domain-containing protein n=1 Tax=Thalassococcus sp. BH17M4-6 TaxID=3413148 RepID=UPI003BC68425
MTGTARETPEFLTVPELAALLRIKERKVYDLAASGAVPCSKVTGKLLFPENEVRAWIAAAASPGTGAQTARAAIFAGSHDPLLDWALRQSRCGIPSYFDGSFDGLDRFAAGEAMATGLHIHDADSDSWNIAAAKDRLAGQNVVLLGFATRQRGLILRPGDAAAIRGIGDLPGRRCVPRQRESGSHALFAHLCAESGLTEAALTLTEPARSETDAVLAVQTGAADVAFGLAALAVPYGLAFVPLVTERFDLLVDRKAWFDPPLQRFQEFVQSDSFASHAATLAGYDLSDLGQVRWNA